MHRFLCKYRQYQHWVYSYSDSSQKLSFNIGTLYYLNERSHLPIDIRERIFKVCEEEFREKFLGLSDEEVINEFLTNVFKNSYIIKLYNI